MWGGWWRGGCGEGGREAEREDMRRVGESGGEERMWGGWWRGEDVGRVMERGGYGEGGGGEDVGRVVEVTTTVTIPVSMSLK